MAKCIRFDISGVFIECCIKYITLEQKLKIESLSIGEIERLTKTKVSYTEEEFERNIIEYDRNAEKLYEMTGVYFDPSYDINLFGFNLEDKLKIGQVEIEFFDDDKLYHKWWNQNGKLFVSSVAYNQGDVKPDLRCICEDVDVDNFRYIYKDFEFEEDKTDYILCILRYRRGYMIWQTEKDVKDFDPALVEIVVVKPPDVFEIGDAIVGVRYDGVDMEKDDWCSVEKWFDVMVVETPK